MTLHFLTLTVTIKASGIEVSAKSRTDPLIHHINFRQKWKGYLWQGRFASFPLDEAHLLAAVRYVEMNPVRARLVERARDWSWSSAKAHLSARDDGVVTVRPMLERVSDWPEFLASDERSAYDDFRKHERTGRPLGDESFIDCVSRLTGRELAMKKPGRKKKDAK